MSKVSSFANARDCSEQKERLSSLKEMAIPKGASNCLSGCVFVMTGTLPALTRAKAKNLIEEYGGKVASSINSKTNVILKGYDEETSKKLQDAQKKGIKITDQEGLFKYIASTDPDKEEKSDDISDVCQSGTNNNNNNNNISIPEIKEYIDKKCDLQTNLLNYLDDSQNVEEKYQTLFEVIDNQNIFKDKIELSNFFQLISKISINHQRFPNFFSKIEKVLNKFSDEMKKFYSNDELFNIFKNSKRILLYLIQEKLIIVDTNFIKKISENKYIKKSYPQYFSPEVSPFKNEKFLLDYHPLFLSVTGTFGEYYSLYGDYKIHPFILALNKFNEPENFNEKRLIGENENEICRLIRQDLVKDFIVYVNKENVDLKTKIKKSIYETNSLLLKNQENITLIEYATFYGSIQIFKYLLNNNVVLTESLWMYAVHGQNPEIFNILEENNIELPKEIADENNNDDNENKEEDEEEDHDDDLEHHEKVITLEDCFFEAIKCHHNDVASFIESNFLNIEKTNSLKYISIYLKHHNLSFIRQCVIDESSVFSLCKYNYYYILELLLKNKIIDVNKMEI